MSELTILQILAAITGMAVGTIPVGIWLLVMELRAIRKVLQARRGNVSTSVSISGINELLESLIECVRRKNTDTTP